MAESKVERSLHRKLAQVMHEVGRIPKNGTAPAVMGGYKFVQVGDATDAIRAALAAQLITMMPTAVQVVGQVDRPTAKGGTMTTVDLITTWTLTDAESGESIEIQSFGAGADGGDKYSGKASTSAMKYALLTGFLLSTGDDSELGPASAAQRPQAPAKPAMAREDGSLIGTAEVGKGQADFELRQTPEGMKVEFRLTSEKGGIKVVAIGPLAEALHAIRETVIGQRVTCWGKVSDQTFRPKGSTRDVTYQVLTLSRIQTPDLTLPMVEAETVPLFDEEPLDAPPDEIPLFDEKVPA